MTTKTEALKLALEALKESQTDNDTMEFWERKTIAILKCQEALAQPEQEPDYRAMYIKVRDELAIEQQR